ncbi:hypothetical protein RhiirA4_538299 [Rhizophagus irregularis]|uniref:Uncharacterized protein n=1 Tax=Rhizophagus irregularis TaxID=588596 RepID=A0A2I1FZB0_9GLOM|nr:hypothetical protein RhiirA4_538299 [Rhizophagus irregularis]
MTDVRCHAKNLYQECWLQDPMLRPTTEEVFNNLESIPIDSATELPILQHLVNSSTKEHDDSISELEVSADINPPTSKYKVCDDGVKKLDINYL